MKLLLLTRALAFASDARFDGAAERRQALRNDHAPSLSCVWSRDADGRLACCWLRDDRRTEDHAIPVEAIQRLPVPAQARRRTPTPTRVTDFRVRNTPAVAWNTSDRPAPGRNPRALEGTGHVRHARPA